MQITIEYESSWRNSFLDGSNNDVLPKRGRKFIGSMTEVKKPGNYIQRNVTKDTVMGVLNRLIGEQAKLYQARKRENYYFKHIEEILKDSDIVDKPNLTNELVYIRNISGNFDRESFSGMIKSNHPAFTSDYSNELWGVLWLELDDLVEFILDDTVNVKVKPLADPLRVCDRFSELQKKKESFTGDFKNVVNVLESSFPDIEYISGKEKKDLFIINLYCSAIYLQVERLSKKYDLTSILTQKNNISGISKKSFTKRDFMKVFVTGGKKPVWGGAYLKKELVKGEGEIVSMLTKASGQLIINLEITREQALDLEKKIINAGVSSFYLGKKGLAYVTDIRV